ncbi:Hypp3889 [Branchiostoma lanceolatum]|uniref:Hypp3889 protein n=1 Tax=Branchiostoma lanceolatum TaxID=7740 RepID=A0A8K0A5H2_BRALA|nr:Hypp3889 [Branchiostoma lanceolatum]
MSDLWARILAQKAPLLRDLEPKHMLNDLLQHGVLDDDEHERVKRAGVTRKDRTEALLDILKGKEVEELAAFMQQLERLSPHLAEQIRTADKETVEKVIPTPRNCRVQSSTRDSLTVAWDQLEAVPGGSVEVAIFAHDDDREPVQRREVGCDQTVVRLDGLRAGTKYNAQVRVVSGELRGPEAMIEAKTETLWASVPLKYVLAMVATVVAVFAVLLMVWITSTGERCLYPKYILDITAKNRPHLFGREEDIANLTMILEKRSICLVSGLSGVGKTAMVKEYLYRKSHEYTAGIVWITSYEQINFLFVGVLREVENRDPIVYDYRDKSFEWMAEYLSKTLLAKYRGKFLFVFDNVETSQHATDILKIVPDKSVHGVTSHIILLSKRELSLPNLGKLTTLNLHPLSEEAAIQLYRSQNKSDVELAETNNIIWSKSIDIDDLKELVNDLGYLPHAIIHYYKEADEMHLKHGVPYTAYSSSELVQVTVLSRRLDLTGYGQSENPIIDEVRKVQEGCPKAYELLAVLSFFDHKQSVPLCVFKGRGTGWEHPTFKGETYYDMAECLKKHSLIKFDNRPCDITLNRIVTYSIIYTLDSARTEHYFWTALEISVRAVERLRELNLTCPHNNDSQDCRGYTKDQLAELLLRVLEHSDIVANNIMNMAFTRGRCYALGGERTGSPNQVISVSLINPALNISSWPVNLTKKSENNELLYEYSWPLTPMENEDDS